MISGKKDLLSLENYSQNDIKLVLDTASKIKKKYKKFRSLRGKTLGMIFNKSSTRTRVSFEVGINQLGGKAIMLTKNEIQLGRGETIEDTGKVLERYLDAIMIRTYDQNDVINLAKSTTIPIINGLTDLYHPCQILADLLTIQEQLKNRKKIKFSYIGDGNNVANSLAIGLTKMKINTNICTPKGFEINDEIKNKVDEKYIHYTNDPNEASDNADVFYTDVWVSMGQEESEKKLNIFKDYQINKDLVKNANPDYLFMHCLPAHRGQEVSADVIDNKNHSIVFDQAENRLHAQKAVLHLLMK